MSFSRYIKQLKTELIRHDIDEPNFLNDFKTVIIKEHGSLDNYDALCEIYGTPEEIVLSFCSELSQSRQRVKKHPCLLLRFFLFLLGLCLLFLFFNLRCQRAKKDALEPGVSMITE